MYPLISIIVPIYKVEDYLPQCIESILSQTYHNLEIILVDDGSPDSCGSICDEYAQKDSRIIVIHKENGGLSDARNAGMEIMCGEYLMFVDSDDWLENHAVMSTYLLAEKYDSDLVIGRFQQIDDDTNEIIFTNCAGTSSVEVVTNTMVMEHFLRTSWMACARLYRTAIHKRILFPVGETNEDEAVVLRLLENCKTIVKTDTMIYNYRYRSNSIMTASFSPNKMNWFRHCQSDLLWIEQYHPELLELMKERYYKCIINTLGEVLMADKQYLSLAQPLLEQVRMHFSDIKSVCPSRRATLLLYLYRFLPVRLTWALLHIMYRKTHK